MNNSTSSINRNGPTFLKLGSLTHLSTHATAAKIAYHDRPSAKQFTDRVEPVALESTFAWIHRSGLGSAPKTAPGAPL